MDSSSAAPRRPATLAEQAQAQRNQTQREMSQQQPEALTAPAAAPKRRSKTARMATGLVASWAPVPQQQQQQQQPVFVRAGVPVQVAAPARTHPWSPPPPPPDSPSYAPTSPSYDPNSPSYRPATPPRPESPQGTYSDNDVYCYDDDGNSFLHPHHAVASAPCAPKSAKRAPAASPDAERPAKRARNRPAARDTGVNLYKEAYLDMVARLAGELTCPICFQIASGDRLKPAFYSCNHLFCSECVAKQTADAAGSKKCPTCRRGEPVQGRAPYFPAFAVVSEEVRKACCPRCDQMLQLDEPHHCPFGICEHCQERCRFDDHQCLARPCPAAPVCNGKGDAHISSCPLIALMQQINSRGFDVVRRDSDAAPTARPPSNVIVL